MTENCIHCGLCTRHCVFLQKYDLDLAALAGHPELAYHCFLCGDCTRNCPQHIDGRQLVLNLRRAQTHANGDTLAESGYGALLAEKKKYLFKNYRGASGKTALFPGCNFPSFFPKTTDALVQLLRKAGIGAVYDCCGKPVGDLGLEPDETRISNGLRERLRKAGIERLIVLCPNCYQYLRAHLDIEIVSIYEVLRELGFDKVIDTSPAPVFLPCPDRDEKQLFQQLQHFLPHAVPIEGTQCCGLGGCAAAKEPELAQGFSQSLRKLSHQRIYTYCASCTGQLRRNGVESAVHILTELLDIHETPALTGIQSLWNRAKRVF